MKERTLWEQAKDNWEVLHALRDEVRAQLHLARMDALARLDEKAADFVRRKPRAERSSCVRSLPRRAAP
jgi:hypothetical protein